MYQNSNRDACLVDILQSTMLSTPSVYRRFSWLSWLSVSVGLLVSGCRYEHNQEVQSAPKGGAILSKEHDGALYFDERYLDSQDVRPQNARIQRQWAIYTQLRRLDLSKQAAKASVSHAGPAPTSDSVFEHVNGGSLVGYANEQALSADIYRKIDSLKKLEHLPITPH